MFDEMTFNELIEKAIGSVNAQAGANGSKEASLVKTKLEEAQLWAHKAGIS